MITSIKRGKFIQLLSNLLMIILEIYLGTSSPNPIATIIF